MKITHNICSTDFAYNGMHAKKRNDNSKKMKRNSGRVSVSIGFNASATMARIAAAKTKSQVAAIERFLRAQLKDAVRYDSDEKTIKAIKKAIAKAGGKVKALGKEERMKSMQQVAKSADNVREEARIGEELIRKKRARKSKERADIADISNSSNNRNGNTLDILCDGVDITAGSQCMQSAGNTVVDVCL